MKLTEIITLAAIAVFATSCEQQNQESETSFSEAVAGTYTGTLTMSVMGTAMDPMEEAQVTLGVENDVWTLTLPEMGMGTMSMESISVEVELAESGEGYTLTAENIDAVSGNLNITGSLTGTVSADGSSMSINAEITPGAMPMAINVDFEGTK